MRDGVYRVKVLGAICACIAVLLIYQQSWSAPMPLGWTDVYAARIDTRSDSNATGNFWYMPGCNVQEIAAERPAEVYQVEACVVEKAGVELAAYPSKGDPDSRAEYAIKLEDDTTFHYIFEFSQNLVLLDDGRLAGSTVDAGGLFIVPVTMLEPYVVSTGPDTSVKAYRIPSSATSSVMVKDGSGNPIHAYRIDVSDNYLYAITEVYGRGGVLVDLSTLEASYVATDLIGATSYNGNAIRQAVSADGKIVATVDSASKRGKIYVIDDSCAGDVFIGPDTASCYSIDFSEQLKANSILANTTPFELSFSSNDTLVMKSYIGDGGNGVVETTITPDPDAERLQYLALGDSYSSGEGDTEQRAIVQPAPAMTLPGGVPPLGTSAYFVKYYRPYTDNEEGVSQGIPREKCHISTRSYPYLLAKGMGLAKGRWNTVACSGAVIADATIQDGYKGQDKDGPNTPRLKDYANYQDLQKIALNEFIPGRVEQMRFVEKYKPKTITLTMGGNDVGFGDIIKACVIPLTEWTATCSYASKDEQKSIVAYQAKSQYGRLSNFYTQLLTKSPRTKLYILGYPQFVNNQPSNAQCGLNVRLDIAERTMAREAVSYMNSIVKAAAQSTGAIYVDIEDSLNGHQLCDSDDRAVTGIALQGMSEIQESFHPNKKGHELIAARVQEALSGQSLLAYTCRNATYVVCPDSQVNEPEVPSYFATAIANNIRSKNEPFTVGKVIKGATDTVFNIFDHTVGANNPVSVLLYSDPVDLGTYTSNSDGGLSATITIPNTVPAGFHTLEVTTTTYSGEPIKLWQIIEVQGADPGDRDEDGIPDGEDACMYINPAGIDNDFDGIDDACDPEINETPSLYHVRIGNDHIVYVERNTKASRVTGVAGDYDENSDGWAIVGAGLSNELSGIDAEEIDTRVGFEVLSDTLGSSYQPVVYVYSEDQKCTAYRPASLAAVVEGESRDLVRAKISNDKCYQDLTEVPDPGDVEQPTPPTNGQNTVGHIKSIVKMIVSFVRAIVSALQAFVRGLFR